MYMNVQTVNILKAMTLLTDFQENMNALKNKIQYKAADIIPSHFSTLLEWCVGTGKSRAFIRACEKIDPFGVHLILCSEKLHIDNWKKEIEETGSMCRFEILTYHSAHKTKYREYGLICLDECHNVTPDRLNKILLLKTKHVVLLSAEVPVEKKLLLTKGFGNFFRWHISLKDAIDKGLIPKPKLTVINVYLDDVEPKYTYRIRNDKKRPDVDATYDNYQSYLRQPVNINVECTEAQYFKLIDNQIEMLQKQFYATKEPYIQNRFLQLGSQRKRLIAEVKTKYIKYLIDNVFLTERLICFTGGIDQCEKMSNNPKEVAHSKTGMPATDQVNAFNNKEINRLFVVNMAREGVNLKDLDIGIIAQSDGSFLMSYQKLGRVVRGKDPQIYVLRLMNTQDEKYVNNFFNALSHEMISVVSFNQFVNATKS